MQKSVENWIQFQNIGEIIAIISTKRLSGAKHKKKEKRKYVLV